MKGTQVEWDARYRWFENSSHGPHIFNVGNTVRLVKPDGYVIDGWVLQRTVHTAHVKWQNGNVTEVQQHDRNITITGYKKPHR